MRFFEGRGEGGSESERDNERLRLCDETVERTLEDTLGTILVVGLEVCAATLAPDGVEDRLALASVLSPLGTEDDFDVEKLLVLPELAAGDLQALVFFDDVVIANGVGDGEIPVALDACEPPGVLAPEEGAEVEDAKENFLGGSFFLELPNQSLNSRASSPLRILASRAFALSCKISSMVRVSRFTTLSFTKVFGIAEIRALIDCSLDPGEAVSSFGARVTSIAPPGSFPPGLRVDECDDRFPKLRERRNSASSLRLRFSSLVRTSPAGASPSLSEGCLRRRTSARFCEFADGHLSDPSDFPFLP